MSNSRKMLRLSTIAAAAVMLSGCQSIHGFFAKLNSRSAEPRIAASAPVNGDLEAGRHFLGEGKLAAAIQAFRAAQADPAALPAASNGLGVAYARLGRFDLADRYFRMALVLEPANDSYIANLLRLQHNYALARLRTRESRQLANAEVAPRNEPPEVATRRGAIQRVGRGQVHIATAGVESAFPLPEVESRSSPKHDRVETEALNPLLTQIAAIGYPLQSDSTTAKTTTYPIRIDLAATNGEK